MTAMPCAGRFEARGGTPDIPPKAISRWKNSFSPRLCRDCNAIERKFGRTKKPAPGEGGGLPQIRHPIRQVSPKLPSCCLRLRYGPLLDISPEPKPRKGDVVRLLPRGLSEIDLLLVGEGASACTNGAADQGAFNRRPDYQSADGADTSTDASARYGAIRGTRPTGAQAQECSHCETGEWGRFHIPGLD